MKKLFLSLVIVSVLILLQACQINDPNNRHNYNPDNNAPSSPTGIQVLNGDNVVDLTWDRNKENDLAGYNIYYSTAYYGKYTLIGSSPTNAYTDNSAKNGVLNYYAVTAYDQSGNESNLSKDVVYATPRPEGFNELIFDFRQFPNTSGYLFSNYSVVNYQQADFFFDNDSGSYYVDVWNDTKILDDGATTDIYDIPFAPESGWSTSNDAKAIVGHTYIVWTKDNHFAKIRVKNILTDRIVFDWAYQLVKGETQLKPKTKGTFNNPRINLIRNSD